MTVFLLFTWQRATFPHSSIIAPGGLNFRVRDGTVGAARLPRVAGARGRHRREPVALAEGRCGVNAVGSVLSGAAGRLRARTREHHDDDYAFCSADGHWFRPR